MLYSVVSFQIGFCIFFLGSHFQYTDCTNLDHNNTYVNRYRRQTQNTTCPLESFQCGSGECIPKENECDGKVECEDGSDELICRVNIRSVCRSLISNNSTKIECSLNGERLKTCIDPEENTIASISCNAFYEEQSLLSNPRRLCKNGTWDYSIPTCTPVCGLKRVQGVTNILIGQNSTLSDYPWQVAVYNADKIHICGGSIINQRIVLSAAHCFADIDGNVYPKENYKVAAGKYYHQYDHPNDINAQYSNIQEIRIPNRYKGIINHLESDIAILILSTPFSLSTNVQPVCIDLQNEYDEPYSTNGTVTGWGIINGQKDRTEVLKEFSLPYIPFDMCFDAVPKSFRRFITYDKICAGYLDQGTAVCQGDGGGPLVFPKIRVNDERYYVRGIVSTSPATNSSACDSNQYGTYTSVAKHVAFIRDIVNLNRLSFKMDEYKSSSIYLR